MLFRMSLNKEMKNKFNIGDRVRVAANIEQPYYLWVEKGDTGVVVEGKPANGFECVKIDGAAYMNYVCVERKYLETDTTYDPKTAFLSELKGLLEKYNASIMLDAKGSYCGDDVESVTMSLCLNNEHIDYTITDFDKEITSNNIMDYDKE